MLVYDCPAEIGRWVAEKGGGRFPPGSFTALGYVEGGTLIGGLIFYGTNSHNIFVSIALSEKRFPRALLRAGLYYVFRQLTLRRLTFFISSGNISSQRLVTRLGAKREATLREAGDDGKDIFVYSLFPEDCFIWSVMQNGQVYRSPPVSRPASHDSLARCGES